MAPKPKLTIEQIGRIKTLAADNIPQVEIAKQMNISRGLVALTLAKSETAGAAIINVDHARIVPSGTNPRQTFDADGITELAASIKQAGLLQNLIVCPIEPDGHYEIIDGERRWRAIRELAAAGDWNALIPCLVKDVEPAEQLLLQLLANLQRENVPPLEEADGFARLHKLDPEIWSYQSIADSISKTVRFVQQRVALATRLHPKFREVFAAGLLNIEGARILCQATLEDQLTILDDWDMLDEGELVMPSENITPAAARYAIEAVERDRKMAQEREQHREHNRRPDAQPSGPINPIRPSGPETGEDAEEISALPGRKDPPPPKYNPVTKGHIYRAHNRKTAALREQIARNHLLAARLVCLALLYKYNRNILIVAMDHAVIPEDRVPPSENIEAHINAFLGKTKLPKYPGDFEAEMKLWKRLEDLNTGDIMKLFAHLVARHCGTFAGIEAELGDTPLAIAIATSAGLHGKEADFGLTLERDDLAGIRKQTLLAIADDAGTPAINDEMKQEDIAAQIARHSASYVLPTLRFATTAEIEKALTFK